MRRVVSHGRYVAFQMAEVAVPRKLFGEILRLSTVLDDFSRYIIAWKLCTTMRSEDVTATLELALKASGCDRAQVALRPRLLSDNGLSYIAGDLAKWLKGQGSGLIRLPSTITLGGWHPTGPYGAAGCDWLKYATYSARTRYR